jgi:hypothetical protein
MSSGISVVGAGGIRVARIHGSSKGRHLLILGSGHHYRHVQFRPFADKL